VCKKRGFVARKPPKMFLSVLNLQKIVSSLIDNNANELTKKYDETVLIKIMDPPFWVDPTILVQINQLGIKVGNETQQYTMQLQADYFTFSSILFGNTSPFSAFIRAKLKIRPLTKTLTMLKLLSNMQVKTEWFYPLSDYG
jgi:putative sterol carrier protein